MMHDKIVLIHIPKTAGSSLRSVLGYALGQVHGGAQPVIGIDTVPSELPYFDGLAQAASHALPDLFHDGLQVMSGHFRYRDIVPVLKGCRDEVSLITFLRDPVKRTISDYLYSMSDRHSGRAIFAETYPTFEDYIQNTGEMNKQVDYLRPFENAPLEVTIDSALHNLDFIGLTEHYDNDLAQLQAGLGTSVAPLEAENVNPNRAQASDAFEKYSDRLREILAPDIALYNAVVERRRFPR